MAAKLRCIKELIVTLCEELSRHGFDAPVTQRATTDQIVRWTRPYSWKEEMIQLAYDPKVPHSLTLGLMVYIPCREGQAPVLLDGRALEMVAGRRDAYLVPSVLTRLRCGGLVQQVIEDLGKGLPWFSIFATPGDALARLESGETNHGRVKGRAYEDLEAYLRKM